MIFQYNFGFHFYIGVDAKHFVSYGYGFFMTSLGKCLFWFTAHFFPSHLFSFFLTIELFSFSPKFLCCVVDSNSLSNAWFTSISPILQLFSRLGFLEHKGSVSVNSVLPVLAIFVFFRLPFLWELSSFWPLRCASFWTLNILLHFLL